MSDDLEPMDLEGFNGPEKNDCETEGDIYLMQERVSNQFAWIINGTKKRSYYLESVPSEKMYKMAENHQGETLVTVYANYGNSTKYVFFKDGKVPKTFREFLRIIKKDVWINRIENDAYDRYKIYVFKSKDECGIGEFKRYWDEIGLDTPVLKYTRSRTTAMGELKSIDFAISIFERIYQIPERECNRCGVCCWGYQMHEMSYGAPYDNRRLSRNIGLLSYRCPNLDFDSEHGLYSCNAAENWPNTCKGFLCEHMQGEKGPNRLGFGLKELPAYDISKFSDVPEFGRCTKKCDDADILPVNIEWFIAFARKHPGSPIIAAKSAELKAKLAEAVSRKRIDREWGKELLDGLDAVSKVRPGVSLREPTPARKRC